MDEKGVGTAPALGVSLNAQFAPGRQFVLQTHVPQECSADELNGLLDKMNAAVDRAEAYYEIEQELKRVEVDENVLLNITRRLNEVEGNIQLKSAASGKRGEYRLSAQEQMQKKQAYDSLEEAKKRVADGRARLEALRKKAGNRDGTSSPANR